VGKTDYICWIAVPLVRREFKRLGGMHNSANNPPILKSDYVHRRRHHQQALHGNSIVMELKLVRLERRDVESIAS